MHLRDTCQRLRDTSPIEASGGRLWCMVQGSDASFLNRIGFSRQGPSIRRPLQMKLQTKEAVYEWPYHRTEAVGVSSPAARAQGPAPRAPSGVWPWAAVSDGTRALGSEHRQQHITTPQAPSSRELALVSKLRGAMWGYLRSGDVDKTALFHFVHIISDGQAALNHVDGELFIRLVQTDFAIGIDQADRMQVSATLEGCPQGGRPSRVLYQNPGH